MISLLGKVFSAKNLNRALNQFGSVSVKMFFVISLIGICLVAIIAFIKKVRGRNSSINDILVGCILSVYGSVMLQLTLICRDSGSRIGIELDIFHGLRGPENDFHWMMLAYVILNVFLFIPYGFIFSMFTNIKEKTKGIQILLVTLISFLTSMVIECTQLITQRGYYEVQDLVANTIGGTLGCVLFLLSYRLINSLRKR